MAQFVINFDIIIVLLLVFCTIKGAIRGVLGQIRATCMIAVPLIVLFFFKWTIMDALGGIAIYRKIVEILYKGLRYVVSVNETLVFNLLTYTLVFAVIGFGVYLLFQVIMPSRKRQVLIEKKTSSRVVGALLGVVNAYASILILFLVFVTIGSYDSTPLIKLFVEMNKDLLKILKS